MPRREDIEKFKEILNSLGSEPEIMARRSQAIEEVTPPEEARPPEAPAGGGAEEAPTPEAGAETAPDFGLDLANLPDIESEPAPIEVPPEPVPAPSEEGAEAGGLDFSSLFAEETAAPPIQELEIPPAEEQFQLPESEAAALQSDLSQMEQVPEEPPREPAAGGEGEALPGSFEDIGSFELESPEAASAPPSEEAMAGIELPNLEDLSLAEPAAGAAAEEAPVPATFEEAPLDMGAPAEEPGLEAPSFEMPSLEEAGAPELSAELPGELPSELPAEVPPEQPGGMPAEAPAEPSPEGIGDEGLVDLGLDQLSFPEPPSGFGGAEAEPVAEKPVVEKPAAEKAATPPRRPGPPREPAAEEAPIPELGGAEGEIALTPEQFARLKETLQSLPRNLKIAVQDVIAEGKAVGADLSKLVALLVSGAAAEAIAAAVGRITGKRIRIPAGYEKRTGLAFEAERRTFAFAFRENILPLLRVFALTIVAAAIVGFMGYRYVYRPLYAGTTYRIGYSHILGDRYTLANESFSRAADIWKMKSWYYRYAEAFADKRQYIFAEQKYDELLREWKDDRKALLDYSRLESTRLADYKKADDLLKILLDKNQYDFDALLAAGDNNLEWAATDHARFEPARLDYATLIEKYGARDDLLFRMMRFFIRTDNAQEIERLRVYFSSREDLRVDPAVYAELGGYLIDHRRLNYVKEILLKADAVKTNMAEIHYNLARYYRLVDLRPDELLALQATLRRLRPSDPLTVKRLTMEIDTHTRLGEVDDARGEYIDGEKELQRAIATIEENQKNRLIGTGPIFGRPYADLADLNYYVTGDMDTARALYQKAIDNSYFDPALDYKIGYTQYAAGDYAGALASFMKTESAWGYPRDPDAPPPLAMSAAPGVDYSGKPPVNLLYTLGNTFYQRGDFFAAQGYYLRLLDKLDARRDAIGALDPADKPEHRSLLETLVRANNNLGVVMDKLAARTGDRTKRSQALVYLATASETEDLLTRTPGGSSVVGPKNLPYLNQRGILYPVSKFVPQIYEQLPRDLGALTW